MLEIRSQRWLRLARDEEPIRIEREERESARARSAPTRGPGWGQRLELKKKLKVTAALCAI
jgi:hypothetical protein